MKTFCTLAAAALFGLASVATAAEPVKLSDQALDSVSAGFARNGFALATTFGGGAFGRTGSFVENTNATVTAQESIVNFVPSSSIRANALSTGTASAGGPGGTGVALGGGVLVVLQ